MWDFSLTRTSYERTDYDVLEYLSYLGRGKFCQIVDRVCFVLGEVEQGHCRFTLQLTVLSEARVPVLACDK